MKGERLVPGNTFRTKTGPRKVYYPDDRAYFQKDQRRYYCQIVGVRHERYRRPSRYNERALRCVLDVEVLSN